MFQADKIVSSENKENSETVFCLTQFQFQRKGQSAQNI